LYKSLLDQDFGVDMSNSPRRTWEVSIRMDLTEVEWEGVDCIVWLRIGPVAGCCEHGNVSLG